MVFLLNQAMYMHLTTAVPGVIGRLDMHRSSCIWSARKAIMFTGLLNGVCSSTRSNLRAATQQWPSAHGLLGRPLHNTQACVGSSEWVDCIFCTAWYLGPAQGLLGRPCHITHLCAVFRWPNPRALIFALLMVFWGGHTILHKYMHKVCRRLQLRVFSEGHCTLHNHV